MEFPEHGRRLGAISSDGQITPCDDLEHLASVERGGYPEDIIWLVVSVGGVRLEWAAHSRGGGFEGREELRCGVKLTLEVVPDCHTYRDEGYHEAEQVTPHQLSGTPDGCSE